MPCCVIAEDEGLLRDELAAMLAAAWPGLEIAACVEDGGAALEAIARCQPDVAFLDIRMPGLTGLDVAQAMASASPHTRVVFVTAYDQYAIDAFDRGAVDYLQKPVSRERLARTVERLKSRAGFDAAQLAGLLQALAPALAGAPKAPPLAWLTASCGQETRLVMVDDVAYFKSDNKYTVVMTAEGEALLKKPIRELLEALDPSVFRQVHRSTIVNLRAVASVARDETGRGVLKLKNRPETLSVSQAFMPLFRNM